MKDAPRLLPILLRAAGSLGAKVESAPADWTGPVLNAEVLRSASGSAPFQRDERDLPKIVGAAQLDDTPVLIGELPQEARRGAVEEMLRRYRNQATIARSWVGTAGPNLQMFLYGPARALSERRWRQLAATVEADDRVCRKLVWLFDEEPSLAAAVQFLQRTFVARPWAEQSVMEELDRMEVALPLSWEAVVDDPELDAEQLVRELVRLERDGK